MELGSPALQADSLPTEPPGKPFEYTCVSNISWCPQVAWSGSSVQVSRSFFIKNGYRVIPVLSVEKTLLSPLKELCILGYNQVSMYVMGLFLDLLLIPLMDLPIFMSEPSCLDHYSFTINLETW